MSAGNILYSLFMARYVRKDPGDAGTINANNVQAQFALFPLVSAAAETRTLAQPTKAGLVVTLVLDTDGGDITLTVTGGYNADADTSLTLGDAGDFVTFISVKVGSSYYWRVLAFEGVNVAGEDLTVDQLTATTLTLNSVSVVPGDMTPGTGISTGVGTICEHRVSKIGGLYKTEILLDITGLNDGDTAGDVIGKDGDTANCHIGQITAAVNGTIIAGRIHCLEVPAGGDVDIDFYGSVDEATLAQDTAIAAATGEEKLIDHGDWAANEIDELTALPDADGYLYLVTGSQGTDADYTGGIFLIELWGT